MIVEESIVNMRDKVKIVKCSCISLRFPRCKNGQKRVLRGLKALSVLSLRHVVCSCQQFSTSLLCSTGAFLLFSK